MQLSDEEVNTLKKSLLALTQHRDHRVPLHETELFLKKVITPLLSKVDQLKLNPSEIELEPIELAGLIDALEVLKQKEDDFPYTNERMASNRRNVFYPLLKKTFIDLLTKNHSSQDLIEEIVESSPESIDTDHDTIFVHWEWERKNFSREDYEIIKRQRQEIKRKRYAEDEQFARDVIAAMNSL